VGSGGFNLKVPEFLGRDPALVNRAASLIVWNNVLAG
jgi:hypothetical protein